LATAHVPAGHGRDKSGEFDYGGYQIALSDCACGGIYSDGEQHVQTVAHKAWKAAQSSEVT
jgi:hypothetical protein